MPYLKFQDDVTVTLKVKSVDRLGKARHWVGSQYVDCAGQACALCSAGIAKSTRHAMEVEAGGILQTWDCPGGAYGHLLGLVGDADAVVGKTLEVTRVKKDQRTLYQFVVVGEEVPQTIAEATSHQASVSAVLRALALMLCDAKFATLLGAYLEDTSLGQTEQEIPF